MVVKIIPLIDGSATTINAHVKGADSTGKRGSKKDETDFEVDESKVKLPSGQCKACEGSLNFLTNNEKHWMSDCPFKKLSGEERKQLFTPELKTHAKSPTEHQEKIVKSMMKHEYEDDDEIADYPWVSKTYR